MIFHLLWIVPRDKLSIPIPVKHLISLNWALLGYFTATADLSRISCNHYFNKEIWNGDLRIYTHHVFYKE